MPATDERADDDADNNKPCKAEEEWRPTSRNLQARYTGPSVEADMTAEQRSIRASILASRPGTGLCGPFGPWLAVPAIAQPLQSLGRACRYGTSLSRRASELVILLTGAKYKSHTEFDLHVGEALRAGVDLSLIRTIPRDAAFSLAAVQAAVLPLLTDASERAIVAFTAELLHTTTVSDETYASTREAVGGNDAVLVEITSIVGYYALVSYTLNVFRIPSV
jgi:4-carboxymuconolactone decarboxylase